MVNNHNAWLETIVIVSHMVFAHGHMDFEN